ncbi:MAG: hypothetical protein ACRDT6_22260 [Micromonosporaceae bacterium]
MSTDAEVAKFQQRFDHWRRISPGMPGSPARGFAGAVLPGGAQATPGTLPDMAGMCQALLLS